MAKLYFRYGTVGSAKTLNLVAVTHNYRSQGKRALLLKPNIDTRFGQQKVKSRAGLEMPADKLISTPEDLRQLNYEGVDCVLVDEAQFLSKEVIEELRSITLKWDLPVLCYGLRTDFKSHLFEGSKRLMELADSIEEIKATCHYCNRKSVMNLKHANGKAIAEGPSVELGAEETYFPTCYACYRSQLQSGQQPAHNAVMHK
jgi:thymidine kinase